MVETKANNNAAELKKLLKTAIGQLNKNNFQTQEMAKAALLLAIELDDQPAVLEAYTLIGQSQMLAGELDSAEISLNSGIEIAETLEDTFYLKRLRVYTGILLRMQGQYSEALTILINEGRGADERFLGTINNNIAMIYDVQGNLEKALEHFEISRRYHEKFKFMDYVAGLLTNEAGILLKLDRIQETREKLFQALEIIESIEDSALAKMFVFIDLGRINIKEEKFEEAIAKFKLARALCKDNNFTQFYHEILSDLANANHRIGEVELAEKLYLQALDTESAKNKQEVLERIHPFFFEIGQLDKAYKYQKQLIEVLREVNKENSKASISSLKNQFEVIEKQKEIDHLRIENALNKELVAKARRIERQNEELKQFSYAISHDLKAPLRSIKGFAQLLRDKFLESLPEEGGKYLTHIIEGTDRMHALIRDIYTYASFESDNKDRDRVDLNRVFENVKQNLSALIKESNAEITSDVLPTISAYPGKMEQIFQNLLQNAITYRKQDEEPKIHIHFSSKPEKEKIHFTFSDNGVGIEPRFHDSVFKLFTRIDRRVGEGTGLGLAITSKVVHQLDGKIWLESEVEKGTDVHIEFPSSILPGDR